METTEQETTEQRSPARFSSQMVRAAAGISYRQLDYWCRIGIIAPEISDACGSGSRRVFSAADLRVIRALASVVNLGAPISQLGPLAALLERLPAWEGPLFISSDARRFGRGLADLDGSPCGFVLDLSAIARGA